MRTFLGDKDSKLPFVEVGVTGITLTRVLTIDAGCDFNKVSALNKLTALLRGTSLEKTEPSFDFSAEQTEAIFAAIRGRETSAIQSEPSAPEATGPQTAPQGRSLGGSESTD